MVRGEAASTRRREKKKTSGHRSYESHFQAILGSYISSNRFGAKVHVFFSLTLTAEIWSSTWLCVCDAWKKNCEKAYLERKVLLEIVINSFPKKYASSFKYIQRTEVSWEVHTLYVFRSQKDKKNFRSATLVLLHQVWGQTKYCQEKRLCQTKHYSAAFFGK